jgi:tetratricopeptide (TPR) repeat protein
VALSADLPDDPALHVQVGLLFSRAGDGQHALQQFQRALQLSPANAAGLAGAGQAAFQLGDYALARKYLLSAPATAEGVKETRELVDLVLSYDPLASRIGSYARRRRLTDGLSHAEERLDRCLAQSSSGDTAPNDGSSLRVETQTFETQLSHSGPLEEDTIEAGVELIDRVERFIGERCPPWDPLDRALVLIAQHHGIDQR